MAPACWILASVPLSWAWLAASGSSAAIRALVTARAVRFRVGRDGGMGTPLWRGWGKGGERRKTAPGPDRNRETRGERPRSPPAGPGGGAARPGRANPDTPPPLLS